MPTLPPRAVSLVKQGDWPGLAEYLKTFSEYAITNFVDELQRVIENRAKGSYTEVMQAIALGMLICDARDGQIHALLGDDDRLVGISEHILSLTPTLPPVAPCPGIHPHYHDGCGGIADG